MIHWTREGEKYKVGLNVYVTKRYIRLVWCWYDHATTTMSARYFRFRFFITPHIIREKTIWNVVTENNSWVAFLNGTIENNRG
jgi:hypothetical protein